MGAIPHLPSGRARLAILLFSSLWPAFRERKGYGRRYILFKAWHDVLGEEDVSTRQLSARIAGSDPAALSRLAESLPDFLGEARADKPATFEIRLGKALRKQVDKCFGRENLRLERGTNHHTGQPLWRVVCGGVLPTPDPLQLFYQPGEPIHEGAAGDAGDQVTSQADMCVQEETTQAPPSGEPDAGRRTSSVQELGSSTAVRDEQHLPQQSPASPAFVQSAQEQAMRAIECPCGHHLDGADDDELFRLAREHVDRDHPEMQRTDDELRQRIAADAYDA